MDIANRTNTNPILRPKDIKPSSPDMIIECLLNPGVFTYNDEVYMLLRVAERPRQKEGITSVPIFNSKGEIEILDFDNSDKDLDLSDPRVINYKKEDFLTTLSHLRLVKSKDGVNFHEFENNILLGQGEHEAYGIEDCRVSQIGHTYYLTYTAVSKMGVAVGLRTTTDWRSFEHHGLIFSPHNKDCAIFEDKIADNFFALHRPSSPELGGNYIWGAQSPDSKHWGNHKCIAMTRMGMWDSVRIGAGAAPIKTDKGWLAIYHGANEDNRYCLGGLLLDLDNPYKVIARSAKPIMEPIEDYEKTGFFGNVVFTNGHIVSGDEVVIYYGASDEVICSAAFSIDEILKSLSYTE